MSPPLPPIPSSISPLDRISVPSPLIISFLLSPFFFLMQLSPIPPQRPLSLRYFFSQPLPAATFLLNFLHRFFFAAAAAAPSPPRCRRVLFQLTARLCHCHSHFFLLLVCSHLAPYFVLLFSDQSSIAAVCDKKVLINQYHSANVITFFSEPPHYGKEKQTQHFKCTGSCQFMINQKLCIWW